ncbi:Ig-like domain-containing protein [Arthrobacter sp. BF1]|uniref:L,D-transpeptidase n=1 Tax=Arthrobacter sp. BF1 TaxID=2821145 RepID=UPI001C4E7DDD|nr:Ig-like domain-containing protein [Arthrobacter sp. BF1]
MAELKETKRARGVLRIALISLVAVGMAITGAGCSILPAETAPGAGSQGTESAGATAAPSTVQATPATTDMTPATGTEAFNPATEVSAMVTNGTVAKAVLEEKATGTPVAGELVVSGRKWISKEPLKFGTDYILSITSEDAGGNKNTSHSAFSTVAASHEADAWVYPAADSTVGVAQPLEFNFSEPVVNKEAVEKAITITTSTGQKGAFRWYSDTMVRYRAENYWPANSKLTVNMALFGTDIGNGMIYNANRAYEVNIGNKVVMEADAANKFVNIFVNDQLTKTFPASMGSETFPSASGFMVLTADKQRFATFKASTIGLKPGDPGDYGSVDVEYATRLSNSGIFIHEATAVAIPYLGITNLSHGCIGLSHEGAGWVFENMRPGDLVHTVGTPNDTILPTDGFGDWNFAFADYPSR